MSSCPRCGRGYGPGVGVCAADGSVLVSEGAGADTDLEEGRLVGEYRIEQRIGAGGYGDVYRAVHPVIGKVAAIKVLHSRCSTEVAEVERFVAEARAVNKIRHRHIVDIFSFGQLEDGRQYYVMEFLEGVTLQEYLRKRKRLTVAETIQILRPVARALDAAHSRGIAHLDLKPDNIFLTADDNEHFPKLLDFGIAKLVGGECSLEMPLGTPLYMSPEQCRGTAIGLSTDIYSFGVVAYEMLTGRVPFSGRSVMEVFAAHASNALIPLSDACSDLPSELNAPIAAMLEKRPEDRPSSLAEAIESFADRAHDVGLWDSLSNPSRVSGVFQTDTYEPVSPSSCNTKRSVGHSSRVTVENRRWYKRYGRPGMWSALLLGGIAIGVGLYPRGKNTIALQSAPPSATASESLLAGAERLSSSSSSVFLDDEDDEIELSIHSIPPIVDVYVGDNRVGVSPGPVRLKKSQHKVKLSFKARGYVNVDMQYAPKASGAISVRLERLRVPERSKPGDLENPF